MSELNFSLALALLRRLFFGFRTSIKPASPNSNSPRIEGLNDNQLKADFVFELNLVFFTFCPQYLLKDRCYNILLFSAAEIIWRLPMKKIRYLASTVVTRLDRQFLYLENTP